MKSDMGWMEMKETLMWIAKECLRLVIFFVAAFRFHDKRSLGKEKYSRREVIKVKVMKRLLLFHVYI